jgi:hypothetical protein
MKSQAIIALILMTALGVANAGDVPGPSPSPALSTNEMEEPPLPSSETTPSNLAPGLLPESGELPARPPTGSPEKGSSTRASAREAIEKDSRFEEIRSLAMNSPRAARLLKSARHSSNSASRRTYLRAYYVTVASRMRKLDPKLKSSIDSYEEEKIHEVSGGRSSTARTSTHSYRRHRTASREVHHRWHRDSRERYRRIMVIDDRYGPEFLPYGPPPPPFFDRW